VEATATLKIETVQVSLTPEDQALFLEFRKRQQNISKLLKSGMFDIKNGYAEIHFDSQGVIGPIFRHEKLTA